MTTQSRLNRMEGFKRIINLSLVLLCLLLETAVFTYHWYFNFRVSIIAGRNQPFWIKGHMLEVAVYFVILILFSNMYGGMRIYEKCRADLLADFRHRYGGYSYLRRDLPDGAEIV